MTDIAQAPAQANFQFAMPDPSSIPQEERLSIFNTIQRAVFNGIELDDDQTSYALTLHNKIREEDMRTGTTRKTRDKALAQPAPPQISTRDLLKPRGGNAAGKEQ